MLFRSVKNIENLNLAKNINFLLDSSKYHNKFDFINEIRNSNFDIIVISPFFKKEPFTKDEIFSLKFKKNGTQRKIIAQLNISETNENEFYWNENWRVGSPSWLKRLSFVEDESIIVEYWNPEWKNILSHYFKFIVDLGFDGAFLTGLDNHQYFEKQTPLE